MQFSDRDTSDNNRKISIVTFFSLANGAAGPGEEAISIGRQLYREGRLHRVVCLGHDKTTKLPQEVLLVPPCRFFYKVVNRIFQAIETNGNFNCRRIREELFDYFVSKNKQLLESDVVLFLKPSFPKTTYRLQVAKKKTIAWASIFHPEFNYQQVINEEKLYKLKGQSSYTDAKRVRNLSRFFSNLNCLLVQSSLAFSIYKEHGVPCEKIYYLKKTFGVDCKKYNQGPNMCHARPFRVLHVSHMSLIKGVGYLFKAWKSLNLHRAELVLGGTADFDIISLRNDIRPPSTKMLGHVKDTVALYQSADVFVSPSISDMYPYTILEAMACGVPVISSNMCGASEVITHGIDGFVYQYDSIKELQGILLWCYENREEVAKMGGNARKKAMLYQRENFAEKVVRQVDVFINQERN